MADRTCQQFQLYAAEANLPLGEVFDTLDELQAFVDGLRDLSVWRRQYADVMRVECHLRPSGSGSVGGWREESGCGIIEMLTPHRNELFVLHEVAHVLAAARYGSHAHDPWFARTYLELVYEAMGSEAYAALAKSFADHGIDHDHDSGIPSGIVLPREER